MCACRTHVRNWKRMSACIRAFPKIANMLNDVVDDRNFLWQFSHKSSRNEAKLLRFRHFCTESTASILEFLVDPRGSTKKWHPQFRWTIFKQNSTKWNKNACIIYVLQSAVSIFWEQIECWIPHPWSSLKVSCKLKQNCWNAGISCAGSCAHVQYSSLFCKHTERCPCSNKNAQSHAEIPEVDQFSSFLYWE